MQSVYNLRNESAIDRGKVQTLLQNFGIPEQAAGEERAPFLSLANRLLDTKNIGQEDRFRIHAKVNTVGEFTDLARRVRTTIFDFVLTEMVVNAVSAADETDPVIQVRVVRDNERNRFRIEVANNGRELQQEEYPRLVASEQRLPGEDRKRLGLILNLSAANVLKIDFKLKDRPLFGGTRFSLSIPMAVAPSTGGDPAVQDVSRAGRGSYD